MNVFIVGRPIETAMALDPKRLHKQVVECKQILSALKGETMEMLLYRKLCIGYFKR